MRIDAAIAGATFREEGTEIVTGLPVGQRYHLEREPSNPHDPNAVKVLVEDYQYGRRKPRTYHLGYIPRKWSGTVSAALKNNQLHVWATKQDNNWGTISISWVDITADPL
jgi:hypothetical protein